MPSFCKDENNDPVLCAVCSTVFTRVFAADDVPDYHLQHSNSHELESAAASGCQICADALDVVLNGRSDAAFPFYLNFWIWSLDLEVAPMQEGILEVSLTCSGGMNPYEALCSYRVVRYKGQSARFFARDIDRNFNPGLVLKWLSECLHNHRKCNSATSSILPSRSLEINSQGDTQQLRIRETTGQVGRYLALSHCWGDVKRFAPLVTTTSNLEAHTENIPISSLPQTFKDAVAVTRALGFRYLWIDSLCILQDSPEDWQRECALMGRVYANAVFTIAASEASHAAVGFLAQLHSAIPHLQRPDGHSSNTKRYFHLTSEDGKMSAQIELQRQTDDDQDLEAYEASLLDSRGWTLQEYLLTPRWLRFTSVQMQFQCDTSWRRESIHYPINHGDIRYLPGLIPKSSLNIVDDQTYQDVWERVIRHFTRRNLTYADDRLPALSGIASRLATLSGDKYLAGLWEKNIIRGLSWFRSRRVEEGQVLNFVHHGNNQPSFFPSSTHYPSWSWPSCESEVNFLTNPNEIHAFVLVR